MNTVQTTISIFFFNDTATTEIYTLSLHDALPIYDDHLRRRCDRPRHPLPREHAPVVGRQRHRGRIRSEEHTSELQSQSNIVCRLLLEKKKNTSNMPSCSQYALTYADTL